MNQQNLDGNTPLHLALMKLNRMDSHLSSTDKEAARNRKLLVLFIEKSIAAGADIAIANNVSCYDLYYSIHNSLSMHADVYFIRLGKLLLIILTACMRKTGKWF